MYSETDEIIAKIKAKDTKVDKAKQLLEIAIAMSERNLEANERHRADIQAQYQVLAGKVDAEFNERSTYIVEFTEALKNVLAGLKDEPVKEGGDVLTDQLPQVTIVAPKKRMFGK